MADVKEPHHVAHDTSSRSSDNIDPEKATHVEQIHTNERVPGHDNYYEKDGLRTEGDGMDHEHEAPVCISCSCKTTD